MTHPQFRSREFLLEHIRQIMAFYHPQSIDRSGGFYHFFRDDGSVYDSDTRHLVSSTRFIINYSIASRLLDNHLYREAAEHGLRFLREAHLDRSTGAYAWQFRWHQGSKEAIDATNHCYGLSFVVLAYAHAVMAGISDARPWLEEAFELMEEHFWDAQHELYADEASPAWKVSPYRGQNTNMHACEAMLAAFDATQNLRYLERAQTLAYNITVRQSSLCNGLIWEHYHADWSPDWEYNIHDTSNIYRPWGYQPGHFTEWTKLLLTLERHRPLPWLALRAEALFDEATNHAWDKTHGGMHYGFAPDKSICYPEKYHWVQAESLAAAALIATRTNKQEYWDWYERIWAYCWEHFVDHQHGAWFRILAADNSKLSNEKSPAGKVDYHSVGACHEILRAMELRG